MDGRILVPVDQWEHSSKTLEFTLAEHPNATIVVLHVVNPSRFYASTSYRFQSMIHNEPPENVDEILQEAGEKIIEETLAGIDVDDREIETHVRIGDVAPSILEFVEDNDIDMVMVGSKGRKGRGRILLGSVAETVARRASVPVTVYR